MTNENLTPAPQAQTEGPRAVPLTARERRRRIILLVLLLLLLALVSLGTWYWLNYRTASLPQLARDDDLLPPPQYLFSITGAGANTLDNPVGVDVSDDGRVYVVDFGKSRVSVFTSNGRFLFAFDKTADGQLKNPVHLQVLGDEVWVTDRRNRALYVFGLDGTFKRQFVPKNEEEFRWTPLALAFDDEGRLHATDVGKTDEHRVIYFSEDGSRTVTFGRTVQVEDVQAEPGGFFFPNGLAVADDGRVFVADGDNRRVQVFDEKGEFERFIDTSGVPRGLAIDEEQRLYVVDALAHTVDVYNLDGERLTQFGVRGFGPGQFNFPNDVALDSRQRIYITDRENNQVQVWGWPALTVPRAAVPQEAWQWALCLLPLLLLPLLLLLRKRRYVLTPDFVGVLVEAGRADVLRSRRLRFVAPREDRAFYEGKVVEDVDFRHIVHFEEYSPSDVAALQDRLRCTESQAIYLTMAERARALLTEDIELRRLGIVAQVRVLDVNEFLEDVGSRSRSGAGKD
jgi:DNA-binding beta-propeller fold protein YncE